MSPILADDPTSPPTGPRRAALRLASRACRASALLIGLLVAVMPSATPGQARPIPTAADVSYGPHPHQLLDVHVPPKGTGPFPVVMWFGGLWSPSKGVPDLRKFHAANCAVVGVEMRVMGDAKAEKIDPPVAACLLDARRALQFVRLNAARWNLDPARIAVAGGSQGALPALHVGCAGERADPASSDPVERVSTRVACVGAWRSQPTIDPKRMQEWVPGVEWGAPALGCGFAESLRRRDELLPVIARWSPDALLNGDAPPIYFENNWGLTRPDTVEDRDYRVHSPAWALGFQKLAQERGATCYVKFPGHPSTRYEDMWDFLLKTLGAIPG